MKGEKQEQSYDGPILSLPSAFAEPTALQHEALGADGHLKLPASSFVHPV